MLCITVMDNILKKDELSLAVGTESGKLMIYKASNYINGYEDINKKYQKEGHVYKVMHQHGLLIWVNKMNIYVKY